MQAKFRHSQSPYIYADNKTTDELKNFNLTIDKIDFMVYNCTNITNTHILQKGGMNMYEKLVVIDKMSHRPIYEQIVEQIQNLIVTEVLKPNEMIPSVRNLSRECGTNPNTVQKAYNELERVGITYSVPGVGRYVSDNAKEIVQKLMSTSNSELKSIIEKLKLSGMTVDEIIDKVKLFYGGEQND